MLGEDRYIEVHLSAAPEFCREHDAEGMYAKADAGEIRNFPGVSSPYETPENPDLVVETDKHSLADCVEQIMALLKEKKVIL